MVDANSLKVILKKIKQLHLFFLTLNDKEFKQLFKEINQLLHKISELSKSIIKLVQKELDKDSWNRFCKLFQKIFKKK